MSSMIESPTAVTVPDTGMTDPTGAVGGAVDGAVDGAAGCGSVPDVDWVGIGRVVDVAVEVVDVATGCWPGAAAGRVDLAAAEWVVPEWWTRAQASRDPRRTTRAAPISRSTRVSLLIGTSLACSGRSGGGTGAAQPRRPDRAEPGNGQADGPQGQARH